MSNPWDFDTDTKVLMGFIAGFLMLTVLGTKTCDGERRREEGRANVQIECLKAGHAALECKELR